jgi:hypothetical protein
MRNDFDAEFGVVDREERDLKKRIIKISLILLLLLVLVTIVTKCVVDSKKDASEEIPLVKAPEEQIKTKHNITEGITVENLDMEVYDSITGTNKKNYDNLNIINQERTIDKDLKAEKEEIKKEKGAEESLNISKTKEANNQQYTELKNELKNNDLVSNIQKGKDLKPSIKVQLSASSSEANSEKYWKSVSLSHPDLFKNKYHFIDIADLGNKGKFYRLQVGYFPSLSDAKQFCDKYVVETKKNKTDCIVISNEK